MFGFGRKSLVAASLMALSLVSCSADEEEHYVLPDGEGPWVLVDIYHATKQNPVDYQLKKGEFNYQGVFGFWRAFEHLENNGYKWTSIHTQPFSRERIEPFDVIFINLVSSDRPDFTDEEVELLIEWVENGGGLFVIADHTNVYDHAERVNRFLMPMGIEVLYHIATDVPPEFSVGGLAWIRVKDFREHPVTAGLDEVSLQTGGPVRSESSGVGFTSTCESAPPMGCSFADYWDPNDDFGYYGNWTWDGDESVEPIGPLEVLTAHEYGEGRIVVFGDQNTFGDAWLHYGQNFELFMNSIEWLAKKEDDAQKLRDFKPMGVNIGIPMEQTNHSLGHVNQSGHLAFYTNSNRDHEVTVRGLTRLDGKDDALLLLDLKKGFDEDELGQIQGYLDAGKRVVITFNAAEINEPTANFLKTFAPEFNLTSSGTTVGPNDDGFIGFDPGKIEGNTWALASEYMSVPTGETFATFDSYATEESPELTGYMLNVSSDWGELLLAADLNGEKVEIARRKRVGQGELVIWFQDEFFERATMGEYLTPPMESGPPYQPTCTPSCRIRGVKMAHEVQFALQDYLKTPIE